MDYASEQTVVWPDVEVGTLFETDHDYDALWTLFWKSR